MSPVAMPPDQAARDRIVADLDTSLLVEAGAGAGKTTQLVARMVALVRTGRATPDRIAAVTFTRKAAAELRERFQAALEAELRATPQDDPTRPLLMEALDRIEHTFLGTIHAFAARLLRERPLEAGLDPAFTEVQEQEAYEDGRRFWRGYLERLAADGSPLLDALAEVRLRPDELERAFHDLVENLDVSFPFDPVSLPTPEDIRPVRERLEALIELAATLLPDEEPTKGWGTTQKRVRTALYSRRHRGWDNPTVFFETLHPFCLGRFEFTQNRWVERGGLTAKELKESFQEFNEDPEPLALLETWLAARYAPALQFVLAAAEAYRDERRRLGRLGFQDLLTFTRDLLRDDPAVRRELGRRIRYLLVDEFQDTDPLQAEIVFLLASDPTDEERAGARPDWRTAVPRPGALFLVGDPKQSIYRFRRADITLYTRVRQRMRNAGGLLRLESNFRSLLPIAGLVNDVFSGVFPEEGSEAQAPFAPLLPQRDSLDDAPAVRMYEASYRYAWGAADAEADALRVAGWIRARVDAGERQPGDFLVLIPRKKHLAAYARALEDRRLGVDVSGAGVGFEREWREVLTLLEALIDPDDPTRVVAALTGLFVGLDLEQLTAFRESGERFSVVREDVAPGPVGEALAWLGQLWQRSRVEPGDVFLGRLVDDVGLFPHAAAAELGTVRAGALAYGLDVVRATALGGDTSLPGIADALRAALAWDEAEAPLEPGRAGAVRLMNLHKAKGLEAPVVVLAHPGGYRPRGRDLHVRRDGEGRPQGYLQITRPDGRSTVPVARPRAWREFEADEERFGRAEHARLVYVAATRARDELLVGRVEGKSHRSDWGILDPWLERHARVEALPIPHPEGPMLAADEELEAIHRETAAAANLRAEAARPLWVRSTVSDVAKGGVDPEVGTPAPAPGAGSPPTTTRGPAWGAVVHAALAAVADRPRADVAAICAALLQEHERPVAADGQPAELEILVALVDGVRASELWARARAAEASLTEVPFIYRLPVSTDGPARLLEGVIDLAFREEEGWVIADYKSDVGDDPTFEARSLAYRRQVDAYADAWTALTGEPVSERILLYTTLGREERW